MTTESDALLAKVDALLDAAPYAAWIRMDPILLRSLAARVRDLEAAHAAAIAGIVGGLQAQSEERRTLAGRARNLDIRTLQDGEAGGLAEAARSIATLHAVALARHAAEVERVRVLTEVLDAAEMTLATMYEAAADPDPDVWDTLLRVRAVLTPGGSRG